MGAVLLGACLGEPGQEVLEPRCGSGADVVSEERGDSVVLTRPQGLEGLPLERLGQVGARACPADSYPFLVWLMGVRLQQ